MKKAAETRAVGLNGCGIERVILAAAQAQIAARRAGVTTASAVCRQTPSPWEEAA